MKAEIKEYIETLKKIVGDGGSKGTYGISFDHWKQLLDYITNLQEENKRLKEENKHIFANVNDDQLLRSNAMNYAELQDYKTRNEKAIEYIKNNMENIVVSQERNIHTGQTELGIKKDYVKRQPLLNILQGKNDK